jgi:hypothetical protein
MKRLRSVRKCIIFNISPEHVEGVQEFRDEITPDISGTDSSTPSEMLSILSNGRVYG